MNSDPRHVGKDTEVYYGILLYVRVLYNCSFPGAHLNVTESSESLKNNRPIKKRVLCVDPLLLLMKSIYLLAVRSWSDHPRKGPMESAEKNAFLRFS